MTEVSPPSSALTTLVDIVTETLWILMLLVFPLALNPWAMQTAGEGHIERALLQPKVVVLLIAWLLSVMACLVVWQQPLPLQIRRDLKVLWGALGVFAVLLLISALTSPYSVLSVNLLGSQTRFDGVLVQVMWYSLVITASVLAGVSRLPAVRFVNWLLLGGSLVALWLLAQTFGVEPLGVFGVAANAASIQPGPLGNPGFTAGYLGVVTTVAALWVLWQAPSRGRVFCLLACYAALVASGNRAAFLGVNLVWLGVLGVQLWRPSRVYKVRGLLISAGLILVGAFLWGVHPARGLLQPTQLVQALEGQDRDTNVRGILWRVSGRILRDHWWLGVGPNGYREAIWQYLEDEEARQLVANRLPANARNVTFTNSDLILFDLPDREGRQGIRRTFDKAHNYLLDIALSSGLFGLLSLLVAYATSLVVLLRQPSVVTRSIGLSVLVYGIYGMAWFAALALDPMVCVVLGTGLGFANRQRLQHGG